MRARGFFLQDLLGVGLGLRLAARCLLYKGAEDEARDFADAAGLATRAYVDATGTNIVSFGADAKRLAELESLDLAKGKREGPGDRDAMGRRIGELLGYPACCVAAFDEKRNDASPLQALVRSGPGPYPAVNNFIFNFQSRAYGGGGELARLWESGYDAGFAFLLPWVPCRFDCAPSAAFGATLFEVLGAFDAPFAARIMELLASTILYFDDWRFAVKRGSRFLPVKTLLTPEMLKNGKPAAVIEFRHSQAAAGSDKIRP